MKMTSLRLCLNVLRKPNIRFNFEKSLLRHFKWERITFIHTTPTLNVMGREIKMPSLSPTMTEGKIVKWLKHEGDSFKPGDLLCEIQTDKAIMAFETEDEGILAKIMVKEDSDIKVGELIGIMVEEGEDWKNAEIPRDAMVESDAEVNVTSQLLPGADSAFGTEVKMPSLSPTMTEGTIIRWLKKEGEHISPGDALCEVQTDKAVMVFETEEEGILAKILVPDNTPEVKVGRIIAIIVDEGEDWRNVSIPKSVESIALPSTVDSASTEKPDENIKQKFWPAVKYLLEYYQIDPKEIPPSGVKGRLLKKDVLQYITEKGLMPKTPHPVPLPVSSTADKLPNHAFDVMKSESPFEYIDREISNMRQVIAKRLSHSKREIPHAYSVLTAQIDNLIASRKELQIAGINISLNDLIIKAVASALTECPFANALYVNDQVQLSSTIDISVAVATVNGLITPIIRSADCKNVIEISSEVKELVDRARKGSLKPHEFQGGSFTISNLGMFGIKEFSAIINPPQCGILAVGSGEHVLVSKGRTVTKMMCTLSYDERAVDQSEAAEFLNSLQYYLQSPALLLSSTIRVDKPKFVEEYAVNV